MEAEYILSIANVSANTTGPIALIAVSSLSSGLSIEKSLTGIHRFIAEWEINYFRQDQLISSFEKKILWMKLRIIIYPAKCGW
ncbi:MAG TPA: hypothetical protein P5275_16255 [Saprospiraceae bacterium]|nr:hypothetical protein [Lewinellaceae bacterium]HPR01987.1 hypothetical protein [Saprospiraceae bacterium]HRV86429.1 hypothetical protein [Saprospiraceae bacterium]